jgi:hypothetical protein
LSKFYGHKGSMTDIQAHLNKIRSDAAECILLSTLVTDGKREVFARMAEHLNGLALEVERTIAANGAGAARVADHADTARAADRKEAVATDIAATDIAAADHQQAARPRRMLPWLLLVVGLGVIAGAFFWTNNPAKEYLSALQSKHEPSPAPQDATKQAIVSLLSGEQRERQRFMEQLATLVARLDNLERALENLKTARAEIAGPSNKESVGAQEKPPAAETKLPAPAEKPVRTEENHTSVPESPAAAKQAELDPRKPGPPACTQFRSFDPVSGTYTTLDGRRRPCR